MPAGSILVVADGDDAHRRLRRIPAVAGYGFHRETEPRGALDWLRRHAAVLVVVVPDGLASVSEMVGAAGEAPLIVLAENGSVRGAVEAMHAGAFDYLVSPWDDDLLTAALGRALAARFPARPPDLGKGREKPMVCVDERMQAVVRMARNVASSDATVLLLGESGTGKELLAAEIHRHSPRRDGPYVAMNCAALPDTLAESELFGHEKGTFTGAQARKAGKFEQADGGTLLLDEISEMPLALQAKLLRVIQEREVDRVGGTRPVPVDVRIIAVSNVDLKQAVADGRFREDLYFRIHVVPLVVPPLRRRPADIVPLAGHFLERCAKRHGRAMRRLAPEAVARLTAYPWPGNIRELEHAIERAVLVGDGETLEPAHLLLDETDAPPAEDAPALRPGVSVREMEARLVDMTLRHVNGNRQQAAEMLGISIRTLRNKLNAYKQQGGSRDMAAHG